MTAYYHDVAVGTRGPGHPGRNRSFLSCGVMGLPSAPDSSNSWPYLNQRGAPAKAVNAPVSSFVQQHPLALDVLPEPFSQRLIIFEL